MSQACLQLLGAGPWQLPVIATARALGLAVLAVDRDPGRPGYGLADRHALCDLTDAAGQLRLAREHGVRGLLSPTSDIGVPAAAAVAEDLGLPGPGRRAARLATDKAALFAAAAAVGLAERRSLLLQPGEPAPAWRGACIVKPVDNQSGRGVRRVAAPAELLPALQHAAAHSRCGRLLVEDWLQGDEYIVDALVCQGDLRLLGLARKRRDPDNPTVAVGIDYLLGPEREQLAARLLPPLRDLLAGCAWGSSLLHAELIDSPQGPQLIDLAARGGGAMIFSHALPAHLGIDVMAMALRLAVGDAPPAAPPPRAAVVIEFLRCPAGRLEAFEGLQALRAQPGMVAVHQAAQAGDELGVAADKDARPGWLICQAGDVAAARRLAAQAKASLRVRLSGQAEPQALR